MHLAHLKLLGIKIEKPTNQLIFEEMLKKNYPFFNKNVGF